MEAPKHFACGTRHYSTQPCPAERDAVTDKPKRVTKKVTVPSETVTENVTNTDSVTENVTVPEPSVTKKVTGICPTCGQKIRKTHAERQQAYRTRRGQK
jgi:hypothetical protein